MPVAARSKRVAVAGGELDATVEGRGEPLLLIAGLGQSSFIWRWTRRALPRWRTIAYDARGTGRSTASAAGCTIELMAEDAAAVLRATADGPAHVVGLSMGGYVALTLARAQPELFRSVVLLATGAGGTERVPRPQHVRDAFEAARGLPPDEYTRATLPYTVAPGWADRNPERLEEVVASRLEAPTPLDAIDAHVEACYRYYGRGIDVERIHAPALVVHGDADLIVPVENGRRLAARLPYAQYVELPGRGHNLPLEEPETVARLIDSFLGSSGHVGCLAPDVSGQP